MEFSGYTIRIHTCHWGKKAKGEWMLSARARRAQSQIDMKKWPQVAKSPQSPEVLDLCQTSAPGEVGCTGNLRNLKEGKRQRECKPLKQPILQSPLWSELRWRIVPDGRWYEWNRSSGQGLKYRRLVQVKKRSGSMKKQKPKKYISY